MAQEILITDIIDVSGNTKDISVVIAEIERLEQIIQRVNKNPINLQGVSGMKELRESAVQLTQALNQLNTTVSGISKTNASKVFQDQAKSIDVATEATLGNTVAQKENLTWSQFVSERMGQYMKIYGSHAEAIKQISKEWAQYKVTGQSVIQTSEQIAAAQKNEIAGSSEKASVLARLNEQYAQATVLAKNLADQFGLESEQAKNAARNAGQLKAQIEELNAVKPAASTPNLSAYEQLRKETKDAEVNARNLAAQFGADSKEALDAAASYDILRQKLEAVNNVTKKTALQNQTPVVEVPITADLSVYEKLRSETKDAELNAKNLAVQFGADSVEALDAAASYDILRQKLEAVNNVTKQVKIQGTSQQFDPNSVPYTENTGNIQQHNQDLEKTGEAVTQLEKEYAATTNEATALGNAQLTANKSLKEAEVVMPEITGSLDEYTGSISRNIQLQLDNNLAIAKNKSQQDELLATLKANGVLTDEQSAKFAHLKTEELSLIDINRDLSATIKNQVKEQTTAQGSIDNLRAKVTLLQRAYEGLSAQEKQTQGGVNLKAQLDKLEPTLKTAEGEIGKFQRNVGNYGNAFTGALKGAFSYLRQIAYILPGIGIAGIIAAITEPLLNFTKDLIGYESAADKAERATKNLTLSLEEQKTALSDYNDSVEKAVNRTIAKLKELGATQDEISGAKNTGVALKKSKVEQDAKANIDLLNAQLAAAKKFRAGMQELADQGNGVAKNFLKTPTLQLATIDINESDLTNIKKVEAALNKIKELQNTKAFNKLDATEKNVFTSVQATTETILSNVKAASTFADQIAQSLADQKAQNVTDVRNAFREQLEGEIAIQQEIKARNKQAILESIQYDKDIKAGNFDALRKQVIAQRDFELNAEKDKVEKINAVRSLELQKPENTEADKIRINSQADREIAQVRLTDKEKEKIKKETASKLFDIDEQERKRNIEADRQTFVDEKKLYAEQVKELANSNEFTTNDRLAFQKEYLNAQKSIIDEEHQAKLESVKYTYLTDKEKEAIETDYQTQIVNLARTNQTEVTTILSTSLEKQEQLHEESIDRIKRLYEDMGLGGLDQYAQDVIDLNNSLNTKLINYDQYLKQRKDLDDKYRIGSLQNTIAQIQEELAAYTGAEDQFAAAQARLDNLRASLKVAPDDDSKDKILKDISVAQTSFNIAKENAEQKKGLLRDLNNAEKDLSDDSLKHDLENLQKRRDVAKEVIGKVIDFVSEVKNLGDTLSDARISQLQAEQTALENRYQREQDLINQTYTNQVDRDRALLQAQRANAAQKAILDDKVKQENIKKARFDKESAIFSIILNTAKAVVEDLGTPWKIAFDLAIGGAELAIAAAQPLPRYFKGKNVNSADKYEGPALVDDGGKAELIVREDGSMEVGSNKPRITYLGKDDIVFPDASKALTKNTIEQIRESKSEKLISLVDRSSMAWKSTKDVATSLIHVTNSSDDSQLRSDLRTVGKNIVTAIKNQPKQKRVNADDLLMRAWLRSNLSWSEFFRR